jgi:hypothetical protein
VLPLMHGLRVASNALANSKTLVLQSLDSAVVLETGFWPEVAGDMNGVIVSQEVTVLRDIASLCDCFAHWLVLRESFGVSIRRCLARGWHSGQLDQKGGGRLAACHAYELNGTSASRDHLVVAEAASTFPERKSCGLMLMDAVQRDCVGSATRQDEGCKDSHSIVCVSDVGSN